MILGDKTKTFIKVLHDKTVLLQVFLTEFSLAMCTVKILWFIFIKMSEETAHKPSRLKSSSFYHNTFLKTNNFKTKTSSILEMA